ncbi:MAG: NAD-dependent DNA ligase LigA [bacterium]
MTKEEAKKRIEKLKETINRYRYLYHVFDRLEISEAALDSLKKELFDLEEQFPEFVTADSPTQRIGGEPLDKFEKIRRQEPMLSLNDAFSRKDVEEWFLKISRLLSSEELSRIDFFCELKIDGLAIELIYEKGILVIGSTRGDGVVGEKVTQNLKTIEAIPLKLNKEANKDFSLPDFNSSIIVRGEAFIPKTEFMRINKEQAKNNLSLYANPRNVAAGSIRQLDPRVVASRKLDFFGYDLLSDIFSTHQEKHQALKAMGFKINSYNRHCRNIDEVFAFYEKCQEIREKLPYEIDGIVVVVNDNKIFSKLGVIGKAPRGAIALKFPLKQAVTVVEDIRVQVGRTGAATPVAYLKPVEIGGATISRATLHNQEEIERLGIRIGDTVIVGRAGDVIPDIIRVLPEMRSGKEKKFKMPLYCPACGAELLRPDGEIVWRCLNPQCFARKRKQLYHFVSRDVFDMVGLGPKIINKLIEEDLVSSPADLFVLREEDLRSLPGFADKKTENIIKEIAASKKISFPRFIYSLGIRNVGEETARELAKHFKNINDLKDVTQEELEQIEDIGPVVSQSICQWFNDKENRLFLERLQSLGIRTFLEETPNQSLKDKVFVLTGSLKQMTRSQAKERIRFLGGTVSESVSAKTSYMVVGKAAGAKEQKARALGVRILTEEEFLNLVK